MLSSLQDANASPYANYLLAFTAAFGFLSIVVSIRLERRQRAMAIGAAVVLMALGVTLASLAVTGRNSVVNLLERNRFETIAGGLGGLLAGLAFAGGRGALLRFSGFVLTLGVVAFYSLLLTKDAIKDSAEALLADGGRAEGRAEAPGVRVEEFAVVSQRR